MNISRLKQLLSYDPHTGIFCRRQVIRGRWPSGVPIGRSNDQGYLIICIDGKRYRAHRLAWLYVHGEWPKEDIDHANGERADNRIINLRQATDSQNLGNAKKPITNKSGKKGVSWHKEGKKWQAHIKVEGRNIYLGLFAELDAAHAAYAAAAKEHRGEFGRAA